MKCFYCRKEARFLVREKDRFMQQLLPGLVLHVCGECPKTSGIKDDDNIEVIPIEVVLEKDS